MIRIAFPASGLSIPITIKNESNVIVSSGTMTPEGALGNGMYWYSYSFDGVAANNYHIIADAGPTITEDSQRYFDFWVEEPSSAGSGGLTAGQANQLADTVKVTDMLLNTGKIILPIR